MNYNQLFIEDKIKEPLSKEELYSYFKKMKSGDKEAREIIISHNIKLVFNRVIKHFYNAPYEKKELISIGLIGLIESVDTFDITKGFQFSTYAVKGIDHKIIDFLRNEKKHINNDSFDKTICTDQKGNKLAVKDTLSNENLDLVSNYERQETKTIIRQLVEELPRREREIITLYFGFITNEPISQKAIANQLGTSQTTVSNTIIKALKKIKMQLELYEIIAPSSNKPSKVKKIKK